MGLPARPQQAGPAMQLHSRSRMAGASKQQSTKKQNLDDPDIQCGGLVIKLNGRLVLNPDHQPGEL